MRFRNFTRKGSDIFSSEALTKMVNADPEKIAQIVGPKDITKALQVRRAVLKYAQQYGTPAEQQTANLAWDRFRGSWFRQHILGDVEGTSAANLVQLNQRLKDIGPSTLNTILGTDAKGRQLLANTKLIGTAMERLGEFPPVHSRTFISMMRGVTAAPMAKIMYSPRLTRMFVRAAEMMPKNPGGASAQMVRLMQMANAVDEGTSAQDWERNVDKYGRRIPQSSTQDQAPLQ
jgi:hypothetical protein